MSTAGVRTTHIGTEPRICVDSLGHGELLLFLHGVGGRRQNWHKQLSHFHRSFHAVAWDARGYGDSDDYPGALAFTSFADDVIRVLDYFGAPKAHIVGLSMGGRIALDLWRRHPARIASLTLADTSAGSRESQDPVKIEAFLAARRKPLLEGLTPRDIAPTLLETLIGPKASAAARSEILESLSTLHADSYIKTLEAVTRFTNFPDFQTIGVPALIITGSEDRVAPPHIAGAIAEVIPGAELVLIEGAGHISNLEAPEAFNAALDRFLMGLAK